jgi:hypothetical protein
MYLSTAPYLSFAGAHLPRLKIPVPLHLLFGRTIAFPIFVWLAKHAPWTLREPADENSFIKLARQNRMKHDDLLELVRVQRLRRQIQDAGLEVVLEHLHVTGTFRRLPGRVPGQRASGRVPGARAPGEHVHRSSEERPSLHGVEARGQRKRLGCVARDAAGEEVGGEDAEAGGGEPSGKRRHLLVEPPGVVDEEDARPRPRHLVGGERGHRRALQAQDHATHGHGPASVGSAPCLLRSG